MYDFRVMEKIYNLDHKGPSPIFFFLTASMLNFVYYICIF